MTRRRLRKSPYRIAQAAKVHDRRATVIPLNAKIMVDEVEDAYGIAEFATYDASRGELHSAGTPKVTVVRCIRADPLAALKAQGVIDNVQFLAGQMWGWAYTRAQIGALKAIDPTVERMDGGRMADPINDTVKRAVAHLRKAALALGRDGEALVTDVIGKGLTLAKAADARGLYSRSGREYVGRRFRECLDCLAIVFGCATPSNPQASTHHNLTPPH